MTHPSGPKGTGPSSSAATLLTTWPASRSQRRTALIVILVSLAFFAIVAPFAKRPLSPVQAFIPAYEAALVLGDLITAVLLFGQFGIARSKAVLTLAAGYLFTALITIAHGLSFPGLFTPTGLLGAGTQSTAWIYMLWHGGFPIFVIAYALLRGTANESMPASRAGGPSIAAAAALTTLVVIAFVLLATAGHEALPPIMQGNRYTPQMIGVVSTVWMTSLIALALLWRRRPHAVLDLWLMIVMASWLFDIALSAVLNAGRFDLGFYTGRIYGLLAAMFVLGVLLLESGSLYARLTIAHSHERERAADLQWMTERLESLNAQLREQSELKSQFLASMSHELRTPLNAIIGFSELLKDGLAGPISEQQRTYSNHIFQSGRHLLALINDILDLSKIEAGKVEIAFSPVPLAQVLRDAVALLTNEARVKGVRLELDQRGQLGVVHVDSRRLKQIVLNLLSNAMKFTPEGGAITLAASVVDRMQAATALRGFGQGLRMPLPASEFEQFLEISVTDTGIGIELASMDRLFMPFSQIPNALTRSIEGTGLGLVMVHRLAELHGGTVSVTSEPRRGSCFTVWLPWRTLADIARSDSHEAHAKQIAGVHALVVEDNQEAAALMQAQLEAKGFVVRCVASAEAALDLVDVYTPDVITLDILLPGMDGWEFLARLKETPKWEAVPVVVVSVVADKGRGFSLGAAGVLQKPVGSDALIKGLERLGLASTEVRGEVTVLVIDDDVKAVDLLAGQLRQCDYMVLRAFGGREGIDLARRHRPHLIALDLQMPEVSGFDVVEALKGDPATAKIPIVVVTAKDLTAAERSQLNGHIHEIVGKAEFNHGRFIGEVQRAMSRVAQ